MTTETITSFKSIQNLFNKRLPNRNIIDDCLLAQSHTQLLNEIKDQIIRKKSMQDSSKLIDSLSDTTCHSISLNPSLSDLKETILKGKFVQEIQESIHSQSLFEVKSKCSIETYEYIQKFFKDAKNKHLNILRKNLQRCNKQIEKLTANNLNLLKQKTNLLWELNLLKPKIKQLQKQKDKIKKGLNKLQKKQQLLLFIETSTTLKQKSLFDKQKKYQHYHSSVLQITKKLQNSNEQFWNIWEKIIGHCYKRPTEQQKLKKIIMEKFKKRFQQFIYVMKLQQERFQTQFNNVEILSDQLKQLINKVKKCID